jgi:FPC/CPF motif-containing protein YcgG
MRYVDCAVLLLVLGVPFAMAEKQKGATTLKDVQPAGTTDKKNKNQQFDFSFDASGMSYICRTSHKTKMKATDFVVGTNLTYQLDEHEGKLKNASGKEVKCTVVRVEKLPATPTAPAARN